MVYLSGLDDILRHKEEFKLVIPNIERIIKVVSEDKQENGKICVNLERKLVSLCFGITMVNDDYQEMRKTIGKQYNSEEGVEKYGLQKLIYNYLSHIDSVLDYLDKFIKDLKRNDVKYERKLHSFDNIINNLRNEVLHEGIPTINVTFSDNSYNENFSCYQWVGERVPVPGTKLNNLLNILTTIKQGGEQYI